MEEEFNRIRRFGTFAETLRVDETFCDIVKGLKDDCIRNWAEAKSADQREDFWRDLQAVARLEQKLKGLGETYRAEAERLERAKKLDESFRLRVEEMNRG